MSIATCVRFGYIVRLSEKGLLQEPLRDFPPAASWTAVALGLMIVTASMAAMRPLFVQVKNLATSFKSTHMPTVQSNHSMTISRRHHSRILDVSLDIFESPTSPSFSHDKRGLTRPTDGSRSSISEQSKSSVHAREVEDIADAV